jgi:hypothetical protein
VFLNTFVNNFNIPGHAFTRSHFHCLRSRTQMHIWNRDDLTFCSIRFAFVCTSCVNGLKHSEKNKCVMLLSLSSYGQCFWVVVECLEMTSVIYYSLYDQLLEQTSPKSSLVHPTLSPPDWLEGIKLRDDGIWIFRITVKKKYWLHWLEECILNIYIMHMIPPNNLR